jgi:hypothetical protein
MKNLSRHSSKAVVNVSNGGSDFEGTRFTVDLGDIELSEDQSSDIRSEIVRVIIEHMPDDSSVTPDPREYYRRTRPPINR